MYALIITDGDVCYCTTHTFERPDLWDWMNQEVEFPPGPANVDIPMPAGYPPEFNEAPTPKGGWPAGSATADVTIASTENDLALALVRDGCAEAGVFEALVTIEAEDDEAKYADKAYLGLRSAGVPEDHIYVGTYY
jgi:hypothetical protein